MRGAKNVMSESDNAEEFPLDPLDHVAGNRCIRIPEDRAIFKNGANKRTIKGFERSLEAKVLGYTANKAEEFKCFAARHFNMKQRAEIFCESEP